MILLGGFISQAVHLRRRTIFIEESAKLRNVPGGRQFVPLAQVGQQIVESNRVELSRVELSRVESSRARQN